MTTSLLNDDDIKAICFLISGSVGLYVALDVRRAIQRLRPSVPLQMGRGGELFVRIAASMVVCGSIFIVGSYVFKKWF